MRIVVRDENDVSYRHVVYDGPAGAKADKVFEGLCHRVDYDRGFYIEEEDTDARPDHAR